MSTAPTPVACGTYWAHYDRLPAMYRSEECRDDGELDLDDDSSRFPDHPFEG